MASKEDFLRKYNSLPLSIRNDVCCVYKGENISWKLAKDYVTANTAEGKAVLDILSRMKLI